MTFWLWVGAGYLVLLVLGFAVGSHLAAKFPGRGRGGADTPVPAPTDGPTHGLEWLPLGTPFDRALIPAAFTEHTVTADVA